VVTAVPVAAAALAGLLIGSFLNVVIHRLPRGEGIATSRSRCPSCGATIAAHDNVPLVSWVLLGGRCRGCRARIPARYPLVEGLTAALFAAVVAVQHADRDIWLGLALMTALVPITFIDLDYRIIPNRITLPAALAAPILLGLTRPDLIPEHLIAGAAAGGFLFLALMAYPGGMGMGDVKLAAVMGLYLGRSVAPAMLVALLAGTLVGVAIMARKGTREGRKTAVPFGPFLSLGGVVGLLAGPAIVDWYLRSFA
jgi:leader peptidase (prepilin peptidase) / N-methyltransferase